MRIDLDVVQPVAASRERVWQCLLDPQFLAACAPGVESVETTGENRFRAILGASVGPIRMKVTLDFVLSDLQPPSRTALAVVGKMRGGEVKADGTVHLDVDGAGTAVRCEVGVEPSGMIATLGGKTLPATARSHLGQFWRTFAERVVAKAPASRPN